MARSTKDFYPIYEILEKKANAIMKNKSKDTCDVVVLLETFAQEVLLPLKAEFNCQTVPPKLLVRSIPLICNYLINIDCADEPSEVSFFLTFDKSTALNLLGKINPTYHKFPRRESTDDHVFASNFFFRSSMSILTPEFRYGLENVCRVKCSRWTEWMEFILHGMPLKSQRIRSIELFVDDYRQQQDRTELVEKYGDLSDTYWRNVYDNVGQFIRDPIFISCLKMNLNPQEVSKSCPVVEKSFGSRESKDFILPV